MLLSWAPRSHRTLSISLAVLTSAASACGATSLRPVGAAAAARHVGPIPAAPEVELARLPMPSLAVPWEPPMLVAGDVTALADALARVGESRVVASERFTDEAWRARIARFTAALGAHVTDAPSEVTPAEVVEHPLSVMREAAATHARPRYDANGLRPGPRRRDPTDLASYVVIEDADIDDATWRAMPAATVGSCDAPLQALARGQERSLAALEGSLDHADRVLDLMFRAELATFVRPLADELAQWADPGRPSGELDARGVQARACGIALARWVEVYRRCSDARTPCAMAPRMFLVGGVRVAAREPDVFVPAGCSEALGTDPVARMRASVKHATEAALGELDPDWIELADRVGTMTELADALVDLCAPRRRRLAPADLAAAQAKLTAIGEDLGSPEPSRAPRWVFGHAGFRVPGVGPVREIVRYDAGPGSPSARIIAGARGLREFVLSRAVCRAGAPDAPLAVTVWPAGRTSPSFFGLFYEEELSCGDLDPLR